MAETSPSVSYRVSAGTLNNMKEAAGNYMPNYGNWRFRVPPPEPEPPPKEKEKVKTLETEKVEEQKDDPVEDIYDQGSDAYSTDGTDAEYEKVWVEGKLPTYKKQWRDNVKNIQTKYGTYDNYVLEAEKWWKENPDKRKDGRWEDRLVKEATQGTSTATSWTAKNGVETGRSTSSSAVKMLGGVGGSAFKSSLEVMEQQIDPYEELMGAASNFRGATSENHDRIKQIVGEMKTNFNNGDKQAQTEQHAELAKLAQNVKEDVGEDSLSYTVKDVIDGQLLSDSTRPQEMELISRYLDRKGVQPIQTPDKEWVNLIPTRNGGQVPMSVSDMSELIAKRTIQYPIGKEFSTALGDFEKHGRQGGIWHPEDIKMQNMNLIKGNPDALASCLLDKGIFGTRPLIEKIKEVYFPDADIDLNELVYQSSQSKETYDEMVDMFAGGLERIAYERYSAGKGKFDEENGGGDTAGMTAAEKIEHYRNLA